MERKDIVKSFAESITSYCKNRLSHGKLERPEYFDFAMNEIIEAMDGIVERYLESTTEKQEPDSVNVSQKKEIEKLIWFGKKHTCEEKCNCHAECPKADEFILSLQEPRQTKGAEEWYLNHPEVKDLLKSLGKETMLEDKVWFGKEVVKFLQEFTLQSVPERPEQKEWE